MQTIIYKICSNGWVLGSDGIYYSDKNETYLEWLAAGNTPIPAPLPTAEEKKAVIQSQIDEIERTTIVPRIVREAMLIWSVSEAQKLGMTEAQLYVANLGYAKVKDTNNQIILLRAQKDAII